MTRLAVTVALAVAGLVSAFSGSKPSPTPAPPDPAGLVLRGMFIGPTAGDDAQTFWHLCDELAACLEFDGSQAAPRIKTGAAVEDLRTAARECRMKGESLGARQPKVKAAIQKHLDEVAGDDGGPLSPAARAAWVAAFRDVARAAEAATK
jgi:hypothetical protein